MARSVEGQKPQAHFLCSEILPRVNDLQGCRFHLQHYIAVGRSVDSLKRYGKSNYINIEDHEEEPSLNNHHTNGEVFDNVSFEDVVSTLKSQIKPREWQVLSGLVDGMALREVVAKFGISYPTAIKYRRKLATLTARLGISQSVGLKQNCGLASKTDVRRKSWTTKYWRSLNA